MRCKDRTFYEVILPESPCHLYFDIEFDKQLNPERDGESSMVIFKEFLSNLILKTLGLQISNFVIQDNGTFSGNILEMDASNFKKFSRHLLIHLPEGLVFRNNHHVAQFVNYLCSQITRIISANESTEHSKLSPDVRGKAK